jgi:pre-mRNA-splicing factor 38B
MGQFIENIFTDINYFNTLFPRIAVTTARDISKRVPPPCLTLISPPPPLQFIERKSGVSAETVSHKPVLRAGLAVKALWAADAKRYDAVIEREGSKPGTWLVRFTGYDNVQETREKDIFFDASTRKKSPSPPRRRSRSRSRSRGRRRSRSRSRERGGGKEKERDARKDNAQEEILRREREKAATSGRDFARRPTSYKMGLSTELQVSSTRRRSKSRFEGGGGFLLRSEGPPPPFGWSAARSHRRPPPGRSGRRRRRRRCRNCASATATRARSRRPPLCSVMRPPAYEASGGGGVC